MSYIISEEQLKHYVDLSKDDPQCYEYALEMQQIIHSRPLPEALKQQRTKMLDAFKTIPRFRQHSINADCIYAADLDQTIEVWENYD